MVMKRSSDTDSIMRNKRIRDSLDVFHPINVDRFSTQSERRFHSPGIARSNFHRKRERDSEINSVKNDFFSYPLRGRRTEGDEKASIRVSNFTRGAADHVLLEKLNYEFKKFGEISVRISRNEDERYAIVYFRNSDDAFEAQRSIENRGRAIFLQDRALSFQFSIPHYSRRVPYELGEKSRPSRVSFPRRKHDHIDSAEDRLRVRERSTDDHNSDDDGGRDAEDPLATRTLFVGNLESSISRQDVRREFERFGIVEDVDIKRPIRGQGSTYAFVKFTNLNVASKAKLAMQGCLFGKNRVKIGYGKSMPTMRLWIGGLGPWTSIDELEREFDRFGAIRRIDYNMGHDHAFILYDSQDAASVAAKNMRGFKINGSRLKIDFAELTQGIEEYPRTLGHLVDDHEKLKTSTKKQEGYKIKSPDDGKRFERERHNSEGSTKWSDTISNHSFCDSKQIADKGEARNKSEEKPKHRGRRTPSPPPSTTEKPRKVNHKSDEGTKNKKRNISGRAATHSRSPSSKRKRKTSGPPPALSPQRFGSVSPEPQNQSLLAPNLENKSSSKENKNKRNGNFEKGMKEKSQENLSLVSAGEESISGKSETLQDIAKRFAVAWRGCLILKNSSFPVRLHLIGGNPEIVEVLRNIPGNYSSNTILRISQRLRLDQPKLEEVSKRMNTAGAIGYCMLLALPGVLGDPPFDTEANAPTQQRPLRNLVTYLKQKQAAGVVNLINSSSPSVTNTKDDGSVLHAFPPCQYSHDQLLKIAPHLGQEALNDDHLVVVVIRGPA